ncbi:MAG TPA: aminotransferase class V-fold PLP-dependent enzyme [Xanthomonadales bacterium]|nr:aminotransferase class V-fold PLP-dependent enzyme [Xanthomonadales bacterium]
MAICTKEIERLRQETPGCHKRIHFNNAGAGLMPQPVLDAIQEHLELEASIGGYEAHSARAKELDASYASVANLLGTKPRNIAFVENATVAFSQALSSIALRPGDVILTSEDDYISNQIMFLSLARRLGVRIERAPVLETGGVNAEAMEQMMDQYSPELVTLTHIPTNSGLVQPVEAIGKACRERDLLYLVDACQSVGQRNVDAESIGCDFLCATSRKFLRGPRGAGFLYVSDRVLDSGLEPLYIDMRGARWTDPDVYQPVDSASRFENWEFAYALVLGTGVAAEYAMAIGLGAISERACQLADDLRDQLEARDLEVLDLGENPGAIVTVYPPGFEPRELMARLHDHRINASISLREYAVLDFDRKGVPWALRLSPHYYNTEEEVRMVSRFFD